MLASMLGKWPVVKVNNATKVIAPILATVDNATEVIAPILATANDLEMVFVFGFSSVGKSTYIQRELGVSNGMQIELSAFHKIHSKAGMTERQCSLQFHRWVAEYHAKCNCNRVVLHFDLFEFKLSNRWVARELRAVFNYPAAIRATGIVADPNELEQRMAARTTIENGKNVYPSKKILGYSKTKDLPALFRFFVEEFLGDKKGIAVNYVVSHPDFRFQPLADLETATKTLTWQAASLEQVKQVANMTGLRLYQKMPLPYNLTAKGSYDHAKSRDIIFELAPPAGKTIFEIGAANGYFSLEAAKMGAKNVRSLEISNGRMETAVMFKRLWGLDNVDFLPLNTLHEFWMTPFTANRYDSCYLLNVIHHIPEPIRMLRMCANVASETVVMELPQPNDPTLKHFPETAALPAASKSNEVPDIFVLNDGYTPFTLTSGAAKKILAAGCRKFEERKSPIAGRMILICYKK